MSDDIEDTELTAADFKIGDEFLSTSTGKRWRVTDVGSRVVVAIKANPADPSWHNGPPYAVAETVWDEYSLEAVEKVEK